MDTASKGHLSHTREEIFAAEIWAHITMLFPPLVPNLYSLFEDLTIFLACHVLLLSFSCEPLVVRLHVVEFQASQTGAEPAAQRVRHTLAPLGAGAPQFPAWSFADKQVVLVLDRAGWHWGAHLRLPDSLHLVFLPPYSPEVQPAERLWPLSNKPLANRVFASLDELEEVQAERCRWLQDHPEVVQAHTCFSWWPPQ